MLRQQLVEFSKTYNINVVKRASWIRFFLEQMFMYARHIKAQRGGSLPRFWLQVVLLDEKGLGLGLGLLGLLVAKLHMNRAISIIKNTTCRGKLRANSPVVGQIKV